MKIIKTKNAREAGKQISELIISEIQKKPNLILCAATGDSPTETYKSLKANKNLFSTNNLRVLKLDEWGGIPMNNPFSCETYLMENLIAPLNIIPSNYIGFSSNSENPASEISRIQKWINNEGTIDICILGIGMNGHLALNEPADALNPDCHIASLSKSTLNHPMATGMNHPPSYGLTLGMKDILSSKQIILIIQGSHKMNITKLLFEKKITSYNPASLLWIHPNVNCFLDIKASPHYPGKK